MDVGVFGNTISVIFAGLETVFEVVEIATGFIKLSHAVKLWCVLTQTINK